jgi:hypothetical protein
LHVLVHIVDEVLEALQAALDRDLEAVTAARPDRLRN